MSRSSLKNVLRLMEEAEETLPPEQGFLQDLQRSIEMTNDKDHTPPSTWYKPSSMQCERNMYYQRTGAEEDSNLGMNYSFIFICHSGTDAHIRIQTAVAQMKDNNIDCEYIDVAEYVKQRGLKDIEIVSQDGMETKLHHLTLHLSFKCDGIIRYKGRYYVLEIKSETESKWFSRKGVDPSHYTQGISYCLALDVEQAIFLYMNRNTCGFKTFMFKPTGEMKQDVIGKIENTEKYVKKKKVPPKPKDVPKKICSYCHYKGRCGKDG